MGTNNNIEKPLVSVILPTYRRNKSLKAALVSLFAQTYNNIEIIVVDDNADYEWNSEVVSIVNHFSANKNLFYINNDTNQGSAKTRNIGIKAACGDYITFLDDDDIYLPEKIEKQLFGMMKENADYSLTDLALYNENDQLLEFRHRKYLENLKEVDLFKCHLMYHMTGTDTMMFKKQYLLDIGCFEPIDVGDEFYLMKKAIEGNGKFCYLKGSDVKAYVHNGEDGLSSGESKIKGENSLYRYKKRYFNILDKKSICYIKMRHYAVIGFAEYRLGNYFSFLVNGIKSFFCYPLACILLVLNRKNI